MLKHRELITATFNKLQEKKFDALFSLLCSLVENLRGKENGASHSVSFTLETPDRSKIKADFIAYFEGTDETEEKLSRIVDLIADYMAQKAEVLYIDNLYTFELKPNAYEDAAELWFEVLALAITEFIFPEDNYPKESKFMYEELTFTFKRVLAREICRLI